MDQQADCVLCQGRAGDEQMLRVEVWEDELWRLTMAIASETPGFSYLEPKRHITDITRLDGPETATLGATLARATAALREVTGVERVYIYVFGDGVAHLHLHLAPHRPGDALNDQMIRGELTTQTLPSGATLIASKEFPPLPEAELRAVAERVRVRLA
ncbi:MAG TPA: HIT domain-containing protein [Ktedonobacterales bacterium]|jgi:diadenosine tetraphosphate (Ap4A) HIT family hydrolase|nr:HIT domain-containing protein [Ktedonobacterales bacterium]